MFNDIVLSDDDTYHCQATNPGAHGRIFNVFSQSVRLTVHRKSCILFIIKIKYKYMYMRMILIITGCKNIK